MRPIDADELKKWIMEAPAPPNELPDGLRIIEFIDSAHTVEPNLTANELMDILKDYRLKNGEWVDSKDGNPDHVTCTCCFKIFNKLDPTWNYCPNCGAKMERHGKWIHKGYLKEANKWDYCECSECKTRVLTEKNYCPNCGAKMDRGKP